MKKKTVDAHKFVERGAGGRFASPNSEPTAAATLGGKIPQGDYDWFIEEAKRRGITKSQLLKEAVRFYRQHHE